MTTDERLEALKRWLKSVDGIPTAAPVPASEDASFRRYFRIGSSPSYIVMDAPPPNEDCRPFVAVAGYLREIGVHAPLVIAADVEQGFLLLTDLGTTPYLDRLGRNADETENLYREALDALLQIQHGGRDFRAFLPPYDAARLRMEMTIFREWLCGVHLKLDFSDDEEALLASCFDAVITSALNEPKVFVHLDYHSRNLMLTDENNPGIIDFQDAVCGPLSYDVVSLLKDCYIKAPLDVIRTRADYFYQRSEIAAEAGLSAEQFRRNFDLMGVQRHLKAAGIFARLLHRDGKPGYLQDVPRTLSYIMDIAPDFPELKYLASLVGERVLPALEHGA